LPPNPFFNYLIFSRKVMHQIIQHFSSQPLWYSFQACFLCTFHAIFIFKNIIPNWDTWIESCQFPSSSPALANEGTGHGQSRHHPWKLPKNPVGQVKWHILTNLDQTWTNLAFLPDYNGVLGSFCGWRRDGPCQWRAPSQLKKPLVGKGRRGGRSKATDETLFKYRNLRLYFYGEK